MPTYNKLVPERIPAIIRQSGNTFTSRVLDDEAYMDALKVKFGEELKMHLACLIHYKKLQRNNR